MLDSMAFFINLMTHGCANLLIMLSKFYTIQIYPNRLELCNLILYNSDTRKKYHLFKEFYNKN